MIKFNYDGDLFFSGSAESKINLWESFTGERIGSYKTRSAVKSLDVDINTEYLVCCGFDGTLEVFNRLNIDFQCERWKISQICSFSPQIKTRIVQLRINKTISHLRLAKSRCSIDDQNL